LNLHYLVESKHWSIEGPDTVEPFRTTLQGEIALGITFPAGSKSTLRIRRGALAPHVRAGADDIGWFAFLPEGAAAETKAKLRISLTGIESSTTRICALTASHPAPVFLPSVLDLDDPFQAQDLVIECISPDAPVMLVTSRRVKREALYRLARGTGIEIGPGPRPQIHNGPDVSVQYVEEKGAEDWLKTYKPDVSDAAWSAENYILGKASDLPVEDSSLDFIFSSHVFEHLYNPLGHLEHWRRKLKSGGLVLGVVPCLDGTKDFVLPATTLHQLIGEYESRQYDVPPEAFRKWAASHRPHEMELDRAASELMAQAFSIHVHVYDDVLATTILRHAVDTLGYSDYAIFYKRNSKDFAFALRA